MMVRGRPAHIGASSTGGTGHRTRSSLRLSRCSPDVCPEACSRRERRPLGSSRRRPRPRPRPRPTARRRASRRATPPRCSRGKKKTRTARRRARFYVTVVPRARRSRIWGYPRRTKPRCVRRSRWDDDRSNESMDRLDPVLSAVLPNGFGDCAARSS